jgi:hypothetical protein
MIVREEWVCNPFLGLRMMPDIIHARRSILLARILVLEEEPEVESAITSTSDSTLATYWLK